jgi:hypothetical protein
MGGSDAEPELLEVRAAVPRARVRVITIDVEGDAIALSSVLGTLLAHALRDEREPEGDGC